MSLFNLKYTNQLLIQVLRFTVKNKLFIFLPLLSFIFTFLGLVLIGFDVYWGNTLSQKFMNIPPDYWYLELAIFFISVLLIIGINTFTNALLVYIASFRLLGKTVSLKEGLKQCWSQRSSLMSWGIFYTSAGFILSLLARTSNFSRVFFLNVKVGWHLCAFLVMPFIIIEKLTPSLAFEKSRQYFSKSAILKMNIYLLLGLYLLPFVILIYFVSLGFELNDLLYQGLFFLILFWLCWGNALNAVLKTAFYLILSGQEELLFLKKDDVKNITSDPTPFE